MHYPHLLLSFDPSTFAVKFNRMTLTFHEKKSGEHEMWNILGFTGFIAKETLLKETFFPQEESLMFQEDL